MKRKAKSPIMLILLLTGALGLASNVGLVEAGGTVYIRADGSVDPPSAPISSVDNVTYTFTDNINDFIVVERDNIVVDGVGYTVQGLGDGTGIDLSGRSNVTVKNLEIMSFSYGVYLSDSSSNNIHGNNITNTQVGVWLQGSSSNALTGNRLTTNLNVSIALNDLSLNNIIQGNNITNNQYFGVWLSLSSNNKISGNNITNNNQGIWLYNSSSNNTLIENIIGDNTDYGVQLISSSDNTLSGNTIRANHHSGVLLHSSPNNALTGNNITNNDACGIILQEDSNHNSIFGNYITTIHNFSVFLWNSIDNRISGNEIANSPKGVFLDSSYLNILSGNKIGNNRIGITLLSSSNNSIYHNNLIDNTLQVDNQTPLYLNSWDETYPSGGNFWSDYMGVDEFSGPSQDEPGSDGIGDTPYVVDENNRDNYPLMEPWTSPTRVNVYPPISYAGTREIFQIEVCVQDVTNLYSFEFRLGYNTTLLDATEVVIQPFLNEPTKVSKSEINDPFGFVWIGVASQPPAEEVDGSGTLVTIFFQVMGLGECILDLYDTEMSNPDGFPMVHSVEDGYYEGGMTQVVSTESTLGSYNPSLAVDMAGNVHVAWNDRTDLDCGSDTDIFYKRFEVGVGWTSTEIVSTESNGTSAWPSLAVGSDGTIHIAWHDNTTDYAGSGSDWDIFYRRFEVGVGWTSTEVVSNQSDGQSVMPSLAVGSDGTIHIAWHDYTNYAGSGSDADIFYKRLVAGLGWTSTEVVSTNSTGNSFSPSLAVDSSGNVHIAWHDDTDLECGSDTDIFYRRFEVGVGWTSTEVVSTESNAPSWYPSLAVDSSRNMLIAWEDETDYVGSGSDWDIFYKRFEVGVGWSFTQVVSTESASGSACASLAVDLARNVHVVWHDSTDYGGSGSDWDIFYRHLRVHFTQYPWSMFRHNLIRTGYTESPAPRKNQTQWTYPTGETASSPAVAIGMVFICADSNVCALDQYTGALVWNYATGYSVQSSPAVGDGKIYVGSGDGKVYCLDALTGSHIWNYTTGGSLWSSPAVADGKVYVGSCDNKTYCLDAATGELIWDYRTGSDVRSSPAVADGKVYVGSWFPDCNVYCLEASTGELVWNYTTGGGVRSSPAVADGKVYVGSCDNKTYCLDASTGALIWKYATESNVYNSPAVADGRVYVGTWGGKFEEAPGDGKVYCLDALTGSHIWNYTTGGSLWSSPAVADGKVYVGSWDNKTYCLDAATGELIWDYTTGDRVWSSPAIADGMVFIGSVDGNVYALGGIIRVPEDYPTIQEAIDAASSGDTIIIAPGTYHESLVINKTLTIIGGTGSSTDFEGGGSGIAVTITGEGASGTIVANVIITNWEQGIFIDNSGSCKIYDNVMCYMADIGIVVEGENAASNLIKSNTIYSNNIAINLAVSSTGNTIYNNTISLNSIGVCLESAGNTIYANTISANNIGINITNSSGNTVYWNNFINNIQVHIQTPFYANIWDNGYPSGGNYWSDYEAKYPYAEELDGSGIWNTPYVIDEYNRDNYPLMHPVHGITVTAVTPYTRAIVVRQSYSLKISVTVVNKGKHTETFKLTLYANTIIIDTVANILLTSGNSVTITFTWDITRLNKGSHTISAQATPVLGEIDTADNTYTDGTVQVIVAGEDGGGGGGLLNYLAL